VVGGHWSRAVQHRSAAAATAFGLTTASTWTAEVTTIITGNDNIAEKIRETHPDRNVHRLAKTEKKVFWFFPSFFSFFFLLLFSKRGVTFIYLFFVYSTAIFCTAHAACPTVRYVRSSARASQSSSSSVVTRYSYFVVFVIDNVMS